MSVLLRACMPRSRMRCRKPAWASPKPVTGLMQSVSRTTRDRLPPRQVFGNVLDGGLDAMAASLAGNDDEIGAVERIEQPAVELAPRVIGVGHFSHQCAVVLRPRVGALGHLAHDELAFVFPTGIGRAHVRVDVVAPAADLAMHRPYHQGVAAARLQLLQVGQRARQVVGVARLEGARAYLAGGDGGERSDRATVAGAPEGGMGDIQPVV